MELISIIVPVYNVLPYLGQCVESLVNQTYGEIEILLVDDGSTDGSGGMCDRLAGEDKRIRVFHQDNKGLSEARNTGIENARGEYLCFVDSDDWVAESYCDRLYHALKENRTGIALCGFQRVMEGFVEEGGASGSGQAVYTERTGDEGTACYLTEEILPWLGDWKSEPYAKLVVAWNKLYEKACFEQIRYPKGKLHEDEFVVHLLLDTQKAVAVVPQILYYYRQRPDSIMGRCDYETNMAHSEEVEAFEDRVRFYRIRNRKAFSDAFHNYMRAANSYYEIYRRKADRLYRERAAEIQQAYKKNYMESRKELSGYEALRFGLFAIMPRSYSRLCSLKYALKAEIQKNGTMEDSG